MPDGIPPDLDDPSIPHDERLYLRVHPDPHAVKYDHSSGKWQPSSANFKSRGNNTQPLSVDLSSLCTPEQTRDRDKSRPLHVAAFTAGTARRFGCRVVRDPLPATANSPANPAHALVFGDHQSGSGELRHNTQGQPISREAEIVLWNELAPPPRGP